MKSATVLTVLLGVLLVSSAGAQEPGDTLWTRAYGGSDFDDGYSVQQTSDGGYVIAGATWSFGAGTGVFPYFLLFWLILLENC